MARITKAEAEKVLAEAGWKPWYPIENEPIPSAYRDPENPNYGIAWLGAYKEVMRRRHGYQLSLFHLTPRPADRKKRGG